MLGMAVALTSCSDDDKYEVGAKVAGAYFTDDIETTLSISSDETSFDVDIYRTEDAPLTFNVTAVDDSCKFTVPQTVTFDEGKTVAKLTISYDPANLIQSQPYSLSLTVGDGIYVGRNSVALTVAMEDPMVTEVFGAGTGTYTYSLIWSGDDTELPVTVSYKPANPNNVAWTVGNWGYGVDFKMTCEDLTAVDAEGAVTIHVPCQFTGYTNSTYGRVYVADLYHYYKDYVGNDNKAATYSEASYYVPETGTFYPALVYYIPEYEDGGYYLGEIGYELFQMDGYPLYGVTVTYDGLFTNRDGDMTARATATCEADVAALKAVMVKGTDATKGVEAILSDAEGVQEYTPGESVEMSFPIEEGGDYTFVVVSFDAEGEAQDYGSDTVTITVGNDNADWEDMGQADFADGWVLAAFKDGSGNAINVLNYMYSVPVQKYIGSKEFAPGAKAYRLVNPYGDDNCPVKDNNVYTTKRNIQFLIEEAAVAITPQESGFGVESWEGQLTIGNYEGYLVQANPGISVLKCATAIASQDPTAVSSYEADENTIYVPMPMFGAPGIGDGDFGYTWSQSPQPAIIILPDASASVRAKVKAAHVAAPKFSNVVLGQKVTKVSYKDMFVAKKANADVKVASLRR